MIDYDPDEVRSFVDNNGDTQTLIDSDTLHNNQTGVRTRLPGFDGLETSKLIKNDNGTFEFKYGEIGGDLNTQVVADVIEQGGFNTLIDTGKEDDYNRELNPLRNDDGQMLTDVLFSEGLAKLDKFTSQKNVTLKREGEVYRRLYGEQDSLFSDQRNAMQEAEESQGLLFKRLALDESEFDENFHSGVQFRDLERTIDNKPRGLLSGGAYSFGSGWDSIKEGAFGYLEAIGEVSDVELLENLGGQGVMRARSQIENTPDLLLNYDQVEGLSTGFQYVINNAAMSAPYMVTSFAALAAAIPLAAVTGGGAVATAAFASVPTSIIYAGQTWNDMEGEKGISQLVAASVSGVGQASLELLGLKGLLVPVKVFSAAGQKKVIEALKSKGLSAERANQVFASAVGKSQKQFLTGLFRVKAEDIADFSKSSLAKATAAGFARESLTEIGQESLAMGTAAGFSDTSYTAEEVQNRLMNAGIAGGTLGSTIGGTVNSYQQSRNKLEKISRSRRDLGRLSVFELYKIGRMQSGEGVATIEQNVERSSKNRNSDTTMPDFTSGVLNIDDAISAQQETLKNANPIKNNSFLQQIIDKLPMREVILITKMASKTIEQLNDIVNGKVNKKGDGNYQTEVETIETQIEVLKESMALETDPAQISKDQTTLEQINENLKKAKETQARAKAELKRREQGGQALTEAEIEAIAEYPEANSDAERKAKLELDRLQKLKESGVAEYNPASEVNKTGSLSQSYIDKQKGIRNVIRNVKHVSDLVDVTAVGLGRLVRGAERSAIKAARAVANPIALDILSRVGGSLGDIVHSGINFKEFQQSLITKAKLIVDELAVANVFGKKALRYSDAKAISEELIEFGKSGAYTIYKMYTQQLREPNLNYVIDTLISETQKIENPNLTREERATAREISKDYKNQLEKVGFTTSNPIIFADELNTYMKVRRQLGSDGLITVPMLAQFLKDKNGNPMKADEISTSDLVVLERNLLAAERLKLSYDYIYSHTNEQYMAENNGKELDYNIEMWWKFQGFNWKAAKKNPIGFKKMLMKELDYSEADAQRVYDSISRRGEQTINAADVGTDGSEKVEYSLIDPSNSGIPFAFTADGQRLMDLVSTSDVKRRKGSADFKSIDASLQTKVKSNGKFKSVKLKPEYKSFFSGNLFETINKVQVDAARYTANAKYFGQGGWKLHRLFRQLEREGDLSREELTQFAFYIKAMINAANGNYNRIENPKLAALNSFVTSWSILAGLPLSAPASFPEFGMVYFDIKDDKMFQQASDQMIRQISSTFSKALDSEANKGRKLAEKVGLDSSVNNIADRLATGERDVAFTRLHEAFFKGVGIQSITQLQRRIVSVVALDAIKSSFSVLETAPTKLAMKGKPRETTGALVSTLSEIENEIEFEERSSYNFDFDKFNEIEMESYNQLTSLGIDVDKLMLMMDDLDSMSRSMALNITDGVSGHLRKEMEVHPDGSEVEVIKPPTQREAAIRKILRQSVRELQQEGEQVNEGYADAVAQTAEYIDNEIGNAIQRYVHERIQMPGHGNRPLFFQDPHFQVITQFNGFISAFTANIIPKLYDRGIRRGTIRTKYETFSLIIMLMILGGASQLLKDIFKFGEPSPYLDTTGYIQRAVYASGVMGQYERVADLAKPLYPQRDEGLEWLMNAALGESGPTIRNIQNLGGGIGDLLQGEGERGIRNTLKTAPLIAPFTGLRGQAAKGLTGTNPYKDVSLPTETELKDFFLGSY